MKWQAIFAELIGTFALIFVGVGSIAANQIAGGGSGLLGVALAHGLTIAVFASALGVISGGYFNPAVTLGALVGRKIDTLNGMGYIVAQCVGAILGAVALRFFIPDGTLQTISFGVPVVNTVAGVTAMGGMLCEAILTFFLVLTVYGTAFDHRAPKVGALFIGLSIVFGILIGGPLTGAALNPARHLGPALVGGVGWADAWVYWIGPLGGGALAGLLYRHVFEQVAPTR